MDDGAIRMTAWWMMALLDDMVDDGAIHAAVDDGAIG